MIIPKRNIETWIAFMRPQEVDEDTIYPRLNKESDCKSWVQDYAKRLKTDEAILLNAPPSFQSAYEELKRFEQ